MKKRPVIIQSRCAIVLLSSNYYSLIDREDAERVRRFNWCKQVCGSLIYAHHGTYKGEKYNSLHRFIMQCDENENIDHIDGNGLNNQKENLRVCSQQENTRNKKSAKNSSSKYLGVSWCKIKKKWRARINSANKNILLGYFDDEKLAALLYNIKARSLFGEFARLNKLS